MVSGNLHWRKIKEVIFVQERHIMCGISGSAKDLERDTFLIHSGMEQVADDVE
jgi:hypothetical protein